MKTFLLVLIAALFATLAISCDDGSRTVQYKVTGTAAMFDVTLTGPDGSITQYASVGSGTSWTAQGFAGNFVGMTAQNGTDQGSVIVTITVDGETFKTANSTGAFVIASVDGSIP